jgi:hypothetical protein
MAPCYSVADFLAPSASYGGDHKAVAGPFYQSLRGVRNNADNLSGQAIQAFKDNFLLKVEVVGDHLYKVACARGRAEAAQEKLWIEARENVANILTHARKAFEDVSRGDTYTWTEVLTAIGWAVQVASLVVGPEGALVGGAVGLVIDITATGLGRKEEKSASVGSYADVVAGLRTMLDGLNSQIRHEEEALQIDLVKILDAVRDLGNRATVDASAKDIPSGADGPVKIIKQDEEDIYLIVKLLAGVRSGLNDIATEARDFPIHGAVTRDPKVGIGRSGPSEQLFDLSDLLQKSLSDLALEVEYGTKALKLAAEAILTTDTGFARQLKDLENEIDGGRFTRSLEELERAIGEGGGDTAWNTPVRDLGHSYKPGE